MSIEKGIVKTHRRIKGVTSWFQKETIESVLDKERFFYFYLEFYFMFFLFGNKATTPLRASSIFKTFRTKSSQTREDKSGISLNRGTHWLCLLPTCTPSSIPTASALSLLNNDISG